MNIKISSVLLRNSACTLRRTLNVPCTHSHKRICKYFIKQSHYRNTSVMFHPFLSRLTARKKWTSFRKLAHPAQRRFLHHVPLSCPIFHRRHLPRPLGSPTAHGNRGMALGDRPPYRSVDGSAYRHAPSPWDHHPRSVHAVDVSTPGTSLAPHAAGAGGHRASLEPYHADALTWRLRSFDRLYHVIHPRATTTQRVEQPARFASLWLPPLGRSSFFES